MTACPFCNAENLKGAEVCEQCGQALSDQHLPVPATDVERCLLRDRLSALKPTKPVTTVAPETTIREVLRLLADNAIGCVVVVQDGRMVGIFSERDALNRLNTRAAELMDQPVSEFMTKAPQGLDAEAKVAFAVHRMDMGSYRHVPITDADNHPTAIISVRDVLVYLTEKMTGAAK